MESGVLCRWKINELNVDVVPVDEEILGFSNRWYREAVHTATTCTLPSGATIHLISPLLFLATKLEAFHDRGNEDYGVSHDMEDIVTVIDGRPDLIDDLESIPDDVREYLRQEFEALLSEPEFIDSINWHLAGDAANQARSPIIIERIRSIAEL